MTAYVIARVAIHDRAPYGRYAAAFLPVLQKYGGRLLVSDEHPEALEGEADGRKVVIMAFADKAAARAWADSPEYQAISEDRRAGSDAIAVMVSSLP